MGGAPTRPKGDAVMAGKKNHVIGTRNVFADRLMIA